MALHVVDGRTAHFDRGDRLRKARELAGIQVQQMADLLGVDRGTIRRYERNVGVKKWTVDAYAERTKFSSMWLEHGDDGEEGASDIGASTLRYLRRNRPEMAA